MTGNLPNRRVLAFIVLAVLASLPYIPTLFLPLISDDYLVIALSKEYGPVSGWPALLADPLYRSRATSMVLTYWTFELFGIHTLAYSVVSLAFHIFNTWLVFLFARVGLIRYRITFTAAAFFAIYEGHQEAVIWFSALPELLVFFFGLTSLLLWLHWLKLGRLYLLCGALGSFLLALFSKESAVVIPPLMAISWLLLHSQWKRIAVGLSPFLVLTAAYIYLVFAGQHANHHFSDGTFQLSAPFWVTIRNSLGRLYWFWGWLSLVVLFAWRPGHWKVWLSITLLWMCITLLPYSFLSYMPRVPSRHTYLASAGLSLLIAVAFVQLRLHIQRLPLIFMAAVIVGHNCGYLWLVKRNQYVVRAAPTEALIQMASQAEGPIFVENFPYGSGIAEHSVELAAGKPRTLLLFDEARRPEARHVFSWNPSVQPSLRLWLAK
ncbi:MAG TPA: hypothetical protein VM120_27010 [Bryobacteraceae bacterium]|nr:hypothetical protein [Bryobacteraceae bacterium]